MWLALTSRVLKIESLGNSICYDFRKVKLTLDHFSASEMVLMEARLSESYINSFKIDTF